MLTVACFFWLDPARRRSYEFSAEDVRIWDRMIERNLTVPHRRVCVTHRPDLIDFMETLPLDPEKHVPGTCCVKLQAHKIGGVAKEGDRLVLLTADFESTRKGVYIMGGAISPSYMKICEGSIQEERHPNLIYTAINDAHHVVEAIRKKLEK